MSETATVAAPELSWADVRRAIGTLAIEKREWAGCPMVSEAARLVLEPRYPFKGLHGAWLGSEPADEGTPDYRVVNSWHNRKRRAMVYVLRELDGRTTKIVLPHWWHGERVSLLVRTLAAARCLDVAAEIRAQDKLRELLTPHAFADYLVVGMFLETSKRSRVTYVFRKGRPTLALRPNASDTMSVLCGLCLHPLGYYEETYCGVMVPTDDVIAHLLLMRGDEHRLWKKAQQHDPDDPLVGL